MISPPAYEALPSYSCTVYKQGYVKWKKEIDRDQQIKQSSWSTVFFDLRGTMLRIYRKDSSKYPMCQLSMLKSYCGIAVEYKKSHVLRLWFSITKEQYVIRPMDDKLSELVSWFEHLQSSANISSDIDRRKMPRLLTLSRGNRSSRRTMTLTIGKTQAVLPILVNKQT
ncbi:uncharacterized protein B0P05DRAFT_562169 [Gilbertella persicaria]|uniref:uncharacterized protein n=1 Tax=Gilbertella persicaria TaxID=101096 RepID=UPI002220AC2B|nr:uncharacterized protein B0P05DRAFT_562169 [Gilbertella persicaria]KAI8052614.1 hypothetical protein B0P05DRAFT_562169 [Gilbertella persicaria]